MPNVDLSTTMLRSEQKRPPRLKETIEPRSLTFRQRAHDRGALPGWMQDIMYGAHGDEEASAQKAKKSTAGFIVAQRKRHAICFLELRRQCAVHSAHLADLFGKLWEGEDAIVAHLVRMSESVQESVTSWDEERKAMKRDAKERVAAVSRSYEDAKLDLAVVKATLRDRDSDVETLELMNSQLKREVEKLRFVIGKYVEGHVVETQDAELELKQEKMRLMTEANSSGEAYGLDEIDKLAKQRMKSVYEMNDEIDELFANATAEGHRQRQVLHDLTAVVEGVDPDDFKGHARKKKGVEKAHVGCQHEAVREEGVRVDKSVPPPRVKEPKKTGLKMPLLLRSQMGSFPATMRIPSLQATLRLILSIYLDKLLYDRNCDDHGRSRLVLGAFPYKYLLKKFGLASLSDEQTTQLVKAVEHHRDTSKRVRLFGEWLGVDDKDRAPPFGVRDSNFVFGLLVALRRGNEFTEAILQDKDQQIDINRKKAVETMKAIFGPILPDGGAQILHRVQNLPAPTQSRNSRCVDLDDLLELTNATWADVNGTWRGHLEFLYFRHAHLYKVKEEMRFADDNGNVDRDVVLVQEDKVKSYVLRDARRPTYVPDPVAALLAEAAAQAGEGPAHDDDDDRNRRPELVAAMTFDAFDALIGEVNPYVEEREVRRMFDDGCALMRDKIHRMFLEVWHRYELRDGVPVLCQPELPPPPLSKLMRGVEPKALTPAEQKRTSLGGGAGGASMPADKPGALAAFDNVDDLAPKAQEADPTAAYFWYSPNTDVSLWVDPWDMVRFDVCEIDKDVFVELALDEFVLPNSPFNPLLAKGPSDLWPNAEAYLAQIEENGELFT